MRTVFTGLGLLFACANAFSQVRVACVGDSARVGESPAELQKALGAKYQVKFFAAKHATVGLGRPDDLDHSPQLALALKFLPQIVVVHLGNEDEPMETVRHDEEFEPALRSMLKKFADLPSHPKVYLWAFPEMAVPLNLNQEVDAYNAYVLPLTKQAAREAGAIEIESELAGSVEPVEVAQFLAEIIAPASLKSDWKIVRVSDSQADEGPAQQAIDGDPDTYWHSEYDPVLAKQPHEIVIDLGKEIWLAGFKYLPRQDGGVNGNVKGYEIYVGDTPASQPTLAAKGNFTRGSNQKIARFAKSVKARYIRFVCRSEQSGGPYASAAEFDILRDPTQH